MENTKTKFAELIENSEKPVLVDFYADWCGPCHTMSPVIAEIAGEFSGKIKVIKVNIDKNPSVSTLYKIMGIPTFILFHKGEIKWRESGVLPAPALKKALSQF
jgi:thioredoxin 1